ncbi:MAG: efflux RND transporter periplasmic adaptor subunit [Burkholderiaceae bacterium]
MSAVAATPPSSSPYQTHRFARAALLIGAAAVLAACSKAAPVVDEDVRPVRTITVGVSDVEAASSYAAEVRPRFESRLSFRVPGKITQRLVDVGSTVKVGQPLARLDAQDLSLAASAAQAQVTAARANFELAQSELKRVQSLADQNFVSASRIEQAQTQLRAAQAQLDAAQAQARAQGNQAAYATLVSDRAGVVTAAEAEAGQVVTAGQTVVRIATLSSKNSDSDVVFSVPEQVAQQLKPGAKASVSLWSAPGKSLNALVREVAPAADPITRTFVVRASLEDPENTASLGATASVRINGGAQQALVVPLNAVVEKDGKQAVWIVDGAIAKRVPVQIAGPALGPTAGGNIASVAIAQGIAPGARVITAGLHTLNEGQKVKLLESVVPTAAPAAPAAPATAAAAKSE